MRHRISPKGQSVSEYTLLGVLVAVASIGALGSMTGVFDNALPGVLDRIFGKPDIAVSAPSVYATTSGPNVALQKTFPGSKTLTITLDSGLEIELGPYADDMTALVETAGANGATRQLASTLENLTKQMLTAEELSPEQAQALMDLANSGHTNANMEAALEKAFQSGHTGPLTYNGVTYSGLDDFGDELFFMYASDAEFPDVEELIRSGDYGPAMELIASSYQNWEGRGQFSAPFLSAYTKALDSGAMEDPAVKTVVDTLSAKILMAGQAIGWTDGDINHPQLMEAANGVLDGGKSVSELTHKDSVGICNLDNGQDTGVECY